MEIKIFSQGPGLPRTGIFIRGVKLLPHDERALEKNGLEAVHFLFTLKRSCLT
jgi:hypothetical protein